MMRKSEFRQCRETQGSQIFLCKLTQASEIRWTGRESDICIHRFAFIDLLMTKQAESKNIRDHL